MRAHAGVRSLRHRDDVPVPCRGIAGVTGLARPAPCQLLGAA